MRMEREICMICNLRFTERKWGVLELCKRCFETMRVREHTIKEERRTLMK